MITNREEVLENALRVFAKMNYEKASLVTIAKACGLSKCPPTSSASGAARCWSSSTTMWKAWKRPCAASWAFLSGLDTGELSCKLRFIYSLIKA